MTQSINQSIENGLFDDEPTRQWHHLGFGKPRTMETSDASPNLRPRGFLQMKTLLVPSMRRLQECAA